MSVTAAQATTLRNAAVAAAVSDTALSDAIAGGNDTAVAAWFNALVSPDYFVWKSNVTRAEVYNTLGPAGTSWDWTTYKNQAVTEQNAWTQMFMGDQCNFGQLNNRVGFAAIFSGAGGPTTQRNHILGIGRRRATMAEKTLAIPVTSPPANTGNNAADARGASTNPDVLTFEGTFSTNDIPAIMRP